MAMLRAKLSDTGLNYDCFPIEQDKLPCTSLEKSSHQEITSTSSCDGFSNEELKNAVSIVLSAHMVDFSNPQSIEFALSKLDGFSVNMIKAPSLYRKNDAVVFSLSNPNMQGTLGVKVHPDTFFHCQHNYSESFLELINSTDCTSIIRFTNCFCRSGIIYRVVVFNFIEGKTLDKALDYGEIRSYEVNKQITELERKLNEIGAKLNLNDLGDFVLSCGQLKLLDWNKIQFKVIPADNLLKLQVKLSKQLDAYR